MSFEDNFTDAGMVMTFISLEIDLTLGYITEIVARRSDDLQVQNLMRPSARLLIYAMWPPEAHEFDTPDVGPPQTTDQGFISELSLLILFAQHKKIVSFHKPRNECSKTHNNYTAADRSAVNCNASSYFMIPKIKSSPKQ